MSNIANQPRFSVVTIALNDIVGLAQTQASIEAQDCSDYEWIIVDGGSTDGTLEYLERLDRPNYLWTSEPDHGLYDAMNKGLARCTGQYVSFMNSGDRFCRPDILARVSALLGQHGEKWDLLFGGAYEETVDGKLLLKSARPANAMKYGMFTHHQAMVYSRRAIADMRYDCKFVIAADYDFTCRLLERGGCSLRVEFPICINKRAGLSERKSEIGRRENLLIQKHVLRLGLMRRTYNHTLFLASSLVRTNMRGLYDRIRFRHAAPAA